MGPRVLIVEDEPDVSLVARMTLMLAGHEVVEVGTAEEALSRIEGGDHDLVLLDLRLPGMDGWELLERLHEQHVLERLPVIVLTAQASASATARALALGCRSFMTKPFTPDQLVTAVDRALQRETGVS